MSRRALILAVVVLLIASSMAVLGSSWAQASPAPAVPQALPSHPSFSTIELRTGNGECGDCNYSYFATGTWFDGYQEVGVNTLYFGVIDPTADSKVTFTLTDPNATRDGVGSPAFQVTVPFNNTTGYYFSYQHSVSYTFPADLKIGGGWNVSVSGALGGNASYPIFVETYYEHIAGSPQPDGSLVLPGESITTNYQALSDVNGAPDTSITNVSYYGYYYGANDNFTNLFSGNGILPQPTTPLGSYTWTVPANATFNTYIYVWVWASIYVNGHQAENNSYYVYYQVGEVDFENVVLSTYYDSQCNSESGYYFDSGSLLQVCALVGAFGGEDQFTAVPNLPVSISFFNGATTVTPPGNTPTSLMSNASGIIAFSFWANTPQFSTWYQPSFYNAVNLTVTDPTAKPVPATNNNIAWWNETFALESSDVSAGVTVTLNQLSFYPGQTITANWAVSATNASVGTITVQTWTLWNNQDLNIGQGTIGSTAATGTLPITLPSGYVGEFTIEIWASNATLEFEGSVSGLSVAPVLFLNPSSTSYTPGSTVTVTAEAWGAASVSAPVITYEVYAEYGLGWTGDGGSGMVSSGTVANGSSFAIIVPSTGAPVDYEVYAYLSGAGGTVASAQLDLEQAWGYNVFVGVSTQSSYSDGSYQPGQTITVTYQIAPYGNAPLPVFYTFEIYLYGTQITSLISTASTSGSVQVTIPSGWQTGFAILEVELTGSYLYGNSCYGGDCFGETGITINAHPSALSMEIGAGSGLTVGWLILLIIILVVLVVLVLLIRRKGRSPPPSGGTSLTTPMNPPAPAPSGPGAAAWQEPSSPPPASDGQPPMPSPPPGAT